MNSSIIEPSIPDSILIKRKVTTYSTIQHKASSLSNLLELILQSRTFLFQFFDDITVFPAGSIWQNLYCSLWLSPFLFMSFTVSSGYNLLLLSIERYLAITNPLKCDEEWIRKNLYWVFPLVWIIGVIVGLPDAFLFQNRDGNCVYVLSEWPMWNSLLLFSWYVFSNFLFPGVTMVVLYILMGITLLKSRESQKQIVQTKINKKADTLAKAQKTIFITCLILVVLFVASWSWNLTFTMLWIGGLISPSETMFVLSTLVIIFNSAVNPFIYIMRYKEFQTHMKIFFCGRPSTATTHGVFGTSGIARVSEIAGTSNDSSSTCTVSTNKVGVPSA